MIFNTKNNSKKIDFKAMLIAHKSITVTGEYSCLFPVVGFNLQDTERTTVAYVLLSTPINVC